MADRIEVSKMAEFAVLGPPSDVIAASKVMMFLILEPGSDVPPDPVQKTVSAYTQKFRRLSPL